MAAIIAEGTYKGKVEKAELKEAAEKGTPYYECVCVITEEGEGKGKRLPWNGWLNEGKTRNRTFQAMIAAGCTFPDDDFENFAGLGSTEVYLQVEHERYTPERSDANPEPKEVVRARVAWVNAALRSIGKPIDEAKKKTLAGGMKAELAKARTGSVETEADSHGNKIGKDGVMRDKSGKEMY